MRQFITSGDAGQQVRDDGSFREYFVRALSGEERADFNADGYVTGEELGLFLNQRMAALTGAAQTPKAGKLHDVRYNQGDLVFALPKGSTNTRKRAPSSGGTAVEITFWESINESGDPAMFAAYLGKYPDGHFAEIARLRLNALEGRRESVTPSPRAVLAGAWTDNDKLTMLIEGDHILTFDLDDLKEAWSGLIGLSEDLLRISPEGLEPREFNFSLAGDRLFVRHPKSRESWEFWRVASHRSTDLERRLQGR